MEYYRKAIMQIESERHFIYVTSKARKIFPDMGEPFTVLVGSKEFECKIDNHGRIWANSNMLRDFIEFKQWAIFIFTKKNAKLFRLVCEHSTPA